MLLGGSQLHIPLFQCRMIKQNKKTSRNTEHLYCIKKSANQVTMVGKET